MGAGLHQEIQTLNTGLSQSIDDARRETRVLFEEYAGRMAVVDEGNNARKRKPKAKRNAR